MVVTFGLSSKRRKPAKGDFMKPVAVTLCAVAVLAVGAIAWRQVPRRVALPVYAEPIRFFSEEHQSLLVGNTARGANGLSAQACASCHRKEHQEWKGSAHARSVTEPVFAAAFKTEQRVLCRSCHSPLQEQHPQLVDQIREKPQIRLNGRHAPPPSSTRPPRDAVHQQMQDGVSPAIFEPNPSYSASLASEGVTCVTCHVRDNTILTSRPHGSSNVPHALSYSPQLAKAEFCAGCHQFNIGNPKAHPFENQARIDPKALRLAAAQSRKAVVGVPVPGPGGIRVAGQVRPEPPVNVESEEPPVPSEPEMQDEYLDEPRFQSTLTEFQASPAARRGETCQSCHMPREGQRGLHTWSGRGSLAMLQKGVELDVSLDKQQYRPGDTLRGEIRITNQAGHAFPTGDSVHAGILDVWVQDGKKTLSRQLYVMSTGRKTGVVSLRGEPLKLVSAPPLHPAQASVQPAANRIQAAQRARTADTRIPAGDKLTLALSRKLDAGAGSTGEVRVRVRVFHSGVHPGFRGTALDPKSNTLTLVREQIVPVRLAPVAAAKAAPTGGRIRLIKTGVGASS